MRIPPVHRIAICSAVSFAVACLSLPAATAQSTPPETPTPSPEIPGQPPGRGEPENPVPGPVVAEAGTGIGLLRVLPNAVPGESILDAPEFDEQLPRQALVETGMGLATAKADSKAYLAQEHAIAESAPFGFAVGGNAPALPGSLAQTAVPDHADPRTRGLEPPSTPLDKLLDLGLLKGNVHARWDEKLGPCVKPIADAETTLASVSALNVLPSLQSQEDELAEKVSGGTSELAAADAGALRDGLNRLAGPLERLGGLLGGAGDSDASGSLLRVPEIMHARSNVRLVDVPGQANKAVRSTSRFDVASIRLFAGTSQELRIDIVSQPTLTATATGDPKTSAVDYSAPVLRISRGGEELFTLDAANPEFELPIGIPLPTSGLDSDVPLVGHSDEPNVLDIGVLRLSLGELTKQQDGTAVRAGARLLDLKILPNELLGFSSALAQISFGEQFARANAPEGGVDCSTSTQPTSTTPPASGGDSPPLAKTSGAYHAVPLFWSGTALLLLGAVLVAALPRRRG
ncbi:hypothetical protein SAMN04487820_106316 [Actinopolyspora mzabensis]|uniref:Gram-positive cocci surface proteins LPxTG domain-containing protein n=1 Tax=Actinopolyspora mzabensis TaxID=995066 RepID=A0A1G9AY81_ACTMZ|nr:hypothetical protein [Actinopolyspora mzabensis]SDK32183.1 hypothetical protein SAMN04487820_106316 [Actinopolyspora mzabensis]